MMRFFLIWLFAIDIMILNAADVNFAIVVTSYNNEPWCLENIKSCTEQYYPRWHLYYINDASTDKTGKLIKEYIKKNKLRSRCTLINNRSRKGALQNIYNIIKFFDPKIVVITVDGDDFLASHGALDRIAKAYKDKNTWMTYGNYLDWPSLEEGYCKAFPKHIIAKNKFRQYQWTATHLRTFYAGLFQRIIKEDLLYNGKFFSCAWDLAMMFPMLEMCGKEHSTFIPDILYFYNRSNPISDFRIHRERQIKFEKYIRGKMPYKPIDKL